MPQQHKGKQDGSTPKKYDSCIFLTSPLKYVKHSSPIATESPPPQYKEIIQETQVATAEYPIKTTHD